MVKTQVTELEANKVALMVEVGKDKVDAAYSNFFQRAAQSVNIPGFRKGKIPRPVLVKYIGQDAIREQISEELVHDAYPKAVREAKVHPVSRVEIEETNLKEGEAFTFKAVVEVRPKLPEFKYSGRNLSVKRAIVDDESLNKVLERLREQFGKITPIEDGQLEFGDYYLANIQAKVDGVVDSELSEEKAYRKFVEENSVFAPLKGVKAGETRVLTHQIDKEEDKNSAHFGKTIEYSVAIERISRPILSELNDEFAKEVGEYTNLEELKKKIREDLEERFKKDADERAIDSIVQEISNETTFSLPEAMIQRTIDFFIYNLDRKWRQFGTSLEDYLKKSEKSMAQFREGFREKATMETRMMMIIDTVAEREKIEVQDSEYRQEVERRAHENGVSVEKLLSYLASGEGEDNIKNILLRGKVDEFLLKNNVIQYDMVNELEINKGDSHGDARTHSH